MTPFCAHSFNALLLYHQMSTRLCGLVVFHPCFPQLCSVLLVALLCWFVDTILPLVSFFPSHRLFLPFISSFHTVLALLHISPFTSLQRSLLPLPRAGSCYRLLLTHSTSAAPQMRAEQRGGRVMQGPRSRV